MIVFIGARAESKRVPDKNTAAVGGLTLLYRAVLSALQMGPGWTIVSSDSEDYLGRIEGIPRVVTIKRETQTPDDQPDREWIREAADQSDIGAWLSPSWVLLRPTTVFRSFTVLMRAWTLWENHYEGWDSLRSVERMSESRYKMYERDSAGKLRPVGAGSDHVKPNHLLPQTYRPNGYIDIIKPSIVASSGEDIYGEQIYGFDVTGERAVEIDTPEDLELARHRAHDTIDLT